MVTRVAVDYESRVSEYKAFGFCPISISYSRRMSFPFNRLSTELVLKIISFAASPEVDCFNLWSTWDIYQCNSTHQGFI